ncbi:MAG TPA: hypothetical protein PLW07_02545, partial [bacterium]|nr:hypothetical protein [bacterium]
KEGGNLVSLYKREMQEGFIEIHPDPPFSSFCFPPLRIPSVVSPFIKGGLRGIFEISPSPSFIKRGVEWGLVKEGDLKLEGNFQNLP